MVSTIEYILAFITKTAAFELEIAPNGALRNEDFMDIEDFSPALYFWRWTEEMG